MRTRKEISADMDRLEAEFNEAVQAELAKEAAEMLAKLKGRAFKLRHENFIALCRYTGRLADSGRTEHPELERIDIDTSESAHRISFELTADFGDAAEWACNSPKFSEINAEVFESIRGVLEAFIQQSFEHAATLRAVPNMEGKTIDEVA